MALEDYTARTEEPQKQRVSRRGFLAGLGALFVGTYLPSQSYSAEPKEPAQKPVAQAKAQGLEGKIPKEYEADLNLLACNWSDEKAREEYNRLGREYMETLMKKGKYDPKKKEALKEVLKPCSLSTEQDIERIKKYLLLQQNPEEYINKYMTKENAEKIRNSFPKLKELSKNKVIGDNYKREFKWWRVDPNNLDISDIIFFLEGYTYAIEAAVKISPISPGTISGNPLVR